MFSGKTGIRIGALVFMRLVISVPNGIDFQQIDEMTEKARKLVLDDDLDENNTVNPSGNSNCNVDKGYFNTYSHFAIHHEMLTVSKRLS